MLISRHCYDVRIADGHLGGSEKEQQPLEGEATREARWWGAKNKGKRGREGKKLIAIRVRRLVSDL